MKRINEDWWKSPEYKEALWAWHNDGDHREEVFEQSEPFRQARLLYRRRVNGSPSSETT